tara:strand:+ start:3274 stop:3546 length:273 start_codon:yes stop_codon:yes gene_type:complete
MDVATTKDEVYEEALNQFGKKLDRRMKLSELQDQLQRLQSERENPTPKAKVRRPKTVRNVITGNVFSYDDLFKGNPDLEVIEWEEQDGDD